MPNTPFRQQPTIMPQEDQMYALTLFHMLENVVAKRGGSRSDIVRIVREKDNRTISEMVDLILASRP